MTNQRKYKISTDRLIEINTWCDKLRVFAAPLLLAAVFFPIYIGYLVKCKNDVTQGFVKIIGAIYSKYTMLQYLSYLAIPAIICLLLYYWSRKELKKR
jgi:hypothetical protein